MLYLIAEKYISRMRMAYSNQPYGGGKILKSDNTVIDLVQFLESGQVVASTVTTPSEVPTTTEGIVRSYDNFSPVAYKVITSDNEIIDLIDFLMSGQLQVSLSGSIVASGPIDTQGYPIISSTNDIVTVDANYLKVRNKICGDHNNTFLEFVDTTEIDFYVNGDSPLSLFQDHISVWQNAEFGGGALFDGMTIFNGSSNTFANLTVNGDVVINTNLSSVHVNALTYFTYGVTFTNSINLGDIAEIVAGVDTHVKIRNEDYTKTINLISSNVDISGTLTANGDIITPNGTDLRLVPGGPLDWVDLVADTVNVQKSLIFDSLLTDNITHDTALNALYFNLANTNVATFSSAGLKLAYGATIDTIDNSGVSYSQTATVTAYSVQQMISAAMDAGVSFRDVWDASGGTFPTTGGTGAGGAIEKGNWWYISVAGTLAGQDVNPGDWITARVDTPGQTGSNWFVSYQGVNTVFGRIGEIVGAYGDYSFPLISGNIATTQLPNSGVNGASQLVQLNASTQLPAVSGVNLTGLTGSLSSSANNLNVSVNGGTASSNVSIINTNVLGVSGTNISSTINGVASNNISVGFSNLTGTIATTQLPGGGVNGASQLVQLNASTQLPAVSGVNLTGLTGTLTSTANNLSVSVNGGTSSANVNIINSNSLSSTANSMTSAVNGVSSSANIINSNSLSSSANSLTSTVNGIASPTANIVNSISLGLSGTALTATVNGITSGSVSVQPANSFVVASSSTQAMAVNTTYYQTYAGQCVYTLPTTAVVDSFVKVISGPANTFKVGQNAGQLTYAPSLNGVSQVTTTGVSGYTYSTDPNTVTVYRCVVADTTWVIESTTSMIGGV